MKERLLVCCSEIVLKKVLSFLGSFVRTILKYSLVSMGRYTKHYENFLIESIFSVKNHRWFLYLERCAGFLYEIWLPLFDNRSVESINGIDSSKKCTTPSLDSSHNSQKCCSARNNLFRWGVQLVYLLLNRVILWSFSICTEHISILT